MLKKDYNSSLKEVLRSYQKNGRLEDKNLDDLIGSLDNISKSTIFSEMLYKFQHGSAKETVWVTEIMESN